MQKLGTVLFIILFFSSIAFCQDKKAVKVLDEAVTLLNKGRYNEAYLKFSEGIRINKTMPELHFGKASAAFNLNLFDTAHAEIDKALTLDGPESKYYDLKGNIYFRDRNYDQAIEYFGKAIDNALNSKEKINLLNTYYNRGSCYLMLKNYKDGLKDFSKAIEENGQFAEAYHNRGICNIRLKNLKEGCEDMQKAVSLGSPRSQKYVDEYCQ